MARHTRVAAAVENRRQAVAASTEAQQLRDLARERCQLALQVVLPLALQWVSLERYVQSAAPAGAGAGDIGDRCLLLLLSLLCQRHDDLGAGRSQLLHGCQVVADLPAFGQIECHDILHPAAALPAHSNTELPLAANVAARTGVPAPPGLPVLVLGDGRNSCRRFFVCFCAARPRSAAVRNACPTARRHTWPPM